MLGQGQLRKYAIRSNTFASKLVDNVLGDRTNATPPEGASGTPLESLKYNDVVSQLLTVGLAPAPLSLLAQFMGEVAKVYQRILNSRQRSACLCGTRVESLQRCGDLWRIHVEESGPEKSAQQFYAQHVAICIGAIQEVPELDHQANINKVMISDDVLTSSGIQQLRLKLSKQGRNVCIVGGSHSAFSCAWVCLNALDDFNSKQNSSIDMQNSNEVDIAQQPISPVTRSPGSVNATAKAGFKAPKASRRATKILPNTDMLPRLSATNTTSRAPCITSRTRSSSMISEPQNAPNPCSVQAEALTISGALKLQFEADKASQLAKTIRTQSQACRSVVQNQQRGESMRSREGGERRLSADGTRMKKMLMGRGCSPHPVSITLLHRSPIKVFYSSKREAEANRYRDFSLTNRYGQIHAFGGLRSDAKALYSDITQGKEDRVRLCQVKPGGSKSLISRCYEEANVIIWATGYKSKTIPVYDADNIEMKLRRSQGQVMVDANGCILSARSSSNDVIPGLYGSGHGYGLPAVYENGELDGSKGRADGVAVYMRQAATVILSRVMGDKFPVTPTTVVAAPESPTKAHTIISIPTNMRRRTQPNAVGTSMRMCSPVKARDASSRRKSK